MINSFLVSLHNNATQPNNPLSQLGDVAWPEILRIKSYTGSADLVNRALFSGLGTSSFEHFLLAVKYVFLVQNSTVADYILSDDSRVTYNDAQLRSQFTGYNVDIPQVTESLDEISKLPVHEFLSGELLEVYRSALSPLDQLAAVVCYFGLRDD